MEDINVYYLKEGDIVLLMILYVDDVYFILNQTLKLKCLHSEIKTQFEMTNLDLLWHSFCMEYFFHSSGITITQCDYGVDASYNGSLLWQNDFSLGYLFFKCMR